MAKGITEATVEEIKARVNLVDLISSYGISVKSAGASRKACCPFHNEKTPSFHINESKGFYHCFGCGESGDAIKFVQKMDGLTFVEAVKKLAGICGVDIEETEDPESGRRSRLMALLSEIALFYHRCLLKAKEAELARRYIEKRGLDGEIADDYLIGYAPNGVSNILKWAEKYDYTEDELDAAGIIKRSDRPGDRGYHRFGGRLMFAIRDRQGRVVGFSGRQLVAAKNSGKYVNSPETPVFKKSKVLYGFDKAAGAITKAPNCEAIICEGQIDCIRLQTSGFPNSVAGQGTAFTEEHVGMLKRFAGQVALVYDDDSAGHKATVKSARLCLAAGLPVRVVSLPGGDDPDSFLRSHPADDFKRLLDAAESIVSFQTRTNRAKEKNPDSVDAVSRVAKQVLQTISQCSDAILRATMVTEASKLLSVPAAALNEELSKLKKEPQRRTQTEDFEEDSQTNNDDETDDAPILGNDAASAIPPPAGEIELCEFLMANEYEECAKTLDGMLGEFLPRQVFAHDFTWRFVEAWRVEIARGEDTIKPWGSTLSPHESEWLGTIIAGMRKARACELEPTDMLQDYIRTLWIQHLKRIRGNLPAIGDDKADVMRLKITLDLKRFNAVKWNTVKELIRGWLSEESTADTKGKDK